MSDEAEFGLVMPFVVCVSKGGPYEDDAFVAGFHLGRIDYDLERRAAPSITATVRTASVPQLDLLAMRHGYRILESETSEEWPEWSTVVFIRGEAPA